MNELFKQFKRIISVFSVCAVLMLNIVIQSPRFLVKERDYDNIVSLVKTYEIAGLTVDMSKPYYSLMSLVDETAKYYFYTINSPTQKDIARFDALRAVAPYWGSYVFDSEILKDVSLQMQNMNTSPSKSAMKLLEYTGTDLALMKLDLYDVCYSIRFRDKAFYLIMQLIGALAIVALLYLFTLNIQNKYIVEDEEYDYDYDEYDDIKEDVCIDNSSYIDIATAEAEEKLANNVKEVLSNERKQYFTKLQ